MAKQHQNRTGTRAPHGAPEHDVTYSFRCPRSMRTLINKAGGSDWMRLVVINALLRDSMAVDAKTIEKAGPKGRQRRAAGVVQ